MSIVYSVFGLLSFVFAVFNSLTHGDLQTTYTALLLGWLMMIKGDLEHIKK